jgi:hypothetical protein
MKTIQIFIQGKPFPEGEQEKKEPGLSKDGTP